MASYHPYSVIILEDLLKKRTLEMWNAKEYNRTTSRFEPRLVYMHTQKPKKLISNAR